MTKIYTSDRQIAAQYNFATDGGAIGTHNLTAIVLPANCVLLGGYVKVTTPLVSAGTPVFDFFDFNGTVLHAAPNITLAVMNGGGNVKWDNVQAYIGGWQGYVPLSAGALNFTNDDTVTAGIMTVVINYNQIP